MKKLTLILALLVAMVTTAMGQIKVSTTLPSEGTPEYRYIMHNSTNPNVCATATTSRASKASEAGLFAFYASKTENAYYIYSIGENKWLTYTIANGYNNGQNFVTLNDTKGDDDKFFFRAYNNGEYYDIAPYNNTGVASKYLNWFDNGGNTLGLWQSNANSDNGSKWFFQEEITSVENLSNDRAYFLESSRGYLLYKNNNPDVVASSVTYSDVARSNKASYWSIYKSPDTGKYYIYNLAANKFIGQNSDDSGRFPFVEKPTNDIQIVSSTKNGYPFVFSTDNYGAINHFNHTAAPGVANWAGDANSGGLRSLDDDGSAHRVFGGRNLTDEEKAKIASLVSAFENITIVYNFTYKGKTIATQESGAKNGDAEYPDVTVTFPYGVSATKPEGSVTSEEKTQTFNIEVDLNLPFQISELDENGKFGSKMHWYKMTLQEKDVRCQDCKSIANATYSKLTPNDLYAFTGNPFDGYKIYNMMAGSSKVLWSSWFNNDGNPIPMTPVEEVTAGTDWLLNANGNGYGFKRKGTDNGYVNNRNSTFSYWNSGAGKTGDGSRITFTEKAADINTIIENYKTDVLAALDIWAACFDVTTVKGSIKNAEAEGCTLVEFINDALASIFAEKYFTIRNADPETTSYYLVRHNTYLSAKSNEKNEAYGETRKDNDAIWAFKNFGKEFYLYNEHNNVYLGTPDSNGDLTANPTCLYYFDNAIAQNNTPVEGALELHCGDKTLHMNNHNSEGNRNNRFLSSWDNDYASCWYIELYEEHVAMIEAVLEAEANNHVETPALGQYTTTAYNALQEFSEKESYTLEEAIVALDAFNRAKNRPLYYIEGQISYAEGKAIYEITADELKFKEIDLYDRTMLWAMDQATETVAITDSVVLTNYASANGFWGADYISIIETESAEDDGIFMFKTNGTGDPVHAQESGSQIVRYTDAQAIAIGGGSTWKFEYVGNSYDIDKLTDEKIEALLALKAAHSARKEHYQAAGIGDAIGEYTLTSKEAFDAILAAGEEIFNASLTDQASKSIEAINEAKTNINNARLTINQPATKKYYRIKGADETQNPSGHYITGNTNWDGGRIALKAEADASTIYYLNENNKLAAYQSGLYIGVNGNNYLFASIDGTTKPATNITFAESPRKAGIYTIKSADRYLHYKVHEGAAEIDRCQSDGGHTTHDWIIEEVTTLPVEIKSVGFATFYAPVAVELPDGVTAHTVTINGEWATLTEIEGGVIPANTGVILAGENGEPARGGTYNLAITTTDIEIEGNQLSGTVATAYIQEGDYVLYNGEKGVGLYPVKANQASYSHKAYLPSSALSSAAQNSAGFRFSFGGTTAVEEVETESENVKAIYDLTGRKLNEITKPGIYIVNGNKVIVR